MILRVKSIISLVVVLVLVILVVVVAAFANLRDESSTRFDWGQTTTTRAATTHPRLHAQTISCCPVVCSDLLLLLLWFDGREKEEEEQVNSARQHHWPIRLALRAILCEPNLLITNLFSERMALVF